MTRGDDRAPREGRATILFLHVVPPERLMEIDSVRAGDDEVIAARGEIDITTAPILSRSMQAAVDGDAERVVVDLCDVSFMDSSGLYVLLNALRRLTRQGRSLSISCREDGAVHRVLSLADLVGTFSVDVAERCEPGDPPPRLRLAEPRPPSPAPSQAG